MEESSYHAIYDNHFCPVCESRVKHSEGEAAHINKDKCLNIGVVGCGFASENGHLPTYLKHRAAKVVAICDNSIEKAQRMATRFKIAHAYTNLTEMLSSQKLDVIDICTPIYTHASLAIQAMEADCHVLVEKPLASTIKEADEVIEVMRRKQVKLCVVHSMLFLPTVLKLKSIVDKGIVGDIVRAEIKQTCSPQDFPAIADPNSWYYGKRGEVFMELLPHPIYFAREFLGEIEPVGVYARKRGLLEHMSFDEIQIVLRGNRCMGTIITSCNGPSLWQLDIYGTKMNLHANLNNSYVITYGGKSREGRGIASLYARENLSRAFQILTSTVSGGVNFVLDKHHCHPILISKFLESIQNGTEPPVTAEDGRENVRVLEDIINLVYNGAVSQTVETRIH